MCNLYDGNPLFAEQIFNVGYRNSSEYKYFGLLQWGAVHLRPVLTLIMMTVEKIF